MKKRIITILFSITFCVSLFAETLVAEEVPKKQKIYHNEIYATIGAPSGIGLIAGAAIAIGEGLAESITGNTNDDSKKDRGCFSTEIGYNYFLNEYFGAGAFVTYEQFGPLDFVTGQGKLIAQYGWTHFKFYHSLSAGIMKASGAEKPNFIFDITLLGLKAEFSCVSIFVEGAVPSTGLLKAGASLKF